MLVLIAIYIVSQVSSASLRGDLGPVEAFWFLAILLSISYAVGWVTLLLLSGRWPKFFAPFASAQAVAVVSVTLSLLLPFSKLPWLAGLIVDGILAGAFVLVLGGFIYRRKQHLLSGGGISSIVLWK